MCFEKDGYCFLKDTEQNYLFTYVFWEGRILFFERYKIELSLHLCVLRRTDIVFWKIQNRIISSLMCFEKDGYCFLKDTEQNYLFTYVFWEGRILFFERYRTELSLHLCVLRRTDIVFWKIQNISVFAFLLIRRFPINGELRTLYSWHYKASYFNYCSFKLRK